MTRPIYAVARDLRADMQRTAGAQWRLRYRAAIPALYATCEMQQIATRRDVDTVSTLITLAGTVHRTERGVALVAELKEHLR